MAISSRNRYTVSLGLTHLSASTKKDPASGVIMPGQHHDNSILTRAVSRAAVVPCPES